MAEGLSSVRGAIAWYARKQVDGTRVEPDPRQVQRTGARLAERLSALGRQPAIERVFKPTLHHLAQPHRRAAPRQSPAGRTIIVRGRFADLALGHSLADLSAPISPRGSRRVAEDLGRAVLAVTCREGRSRCWRSSSTLEASAIVHLGCCLTGDEGRGLHKKGVA